jgi:type III pantothenate kinase
MKLLIDLGNSRAKLALWDGEALQPVTTLGHGANDFSARLEQAFAALPPIDAVWIADVARADRSAALAAACARHFAGAQCERLQSPAFALGVRNAYAEPARLGIDRWLALVAAHARGGGAKLIASIGTALTVDALAADGQHLGGLIAPGPELMQQSVLSATGRVAMRRNGQVAEFGTSTEDGLFSGCWLAAAALIERSYRALGKKAASEPTLLLTGGGGETLAPLLSIPSQRAPLLVLEGLARYAS